MPQGCGEALRGYQCRLIAYPKRGTAFPTSITADDGVYNDGKGSECSGRRCARAPVYSSGISNSCPWNHSTSAL